MPEELPRSVVQARIQLMLGEPYLASAVARLPLVNAADLGWCDTMATDGYNIYVNPQFCETLSKDEIAFVLAHELMHCLLGHIDRRGTRDHGVWNYAIDYATNLMLQDFGLQMPKVGLIDRKYYGMTAEDIYDQLAAAGKTMGGLGSQDQAGGEGKGGFDIHLSPDDARGSAARGRDFPTAEERQRLRSTLAQDLVAKLRGTMAGNWQSEIQKGAQSQVSWQVLLARFFTGLRRDDYRLFPPNRKHVWRGIYLPSIGTPGPSHLVVAIDTSGSMDDEQLSRILAELDQLRSATQCDLTLVQCDAAVQNVEEFDAYTEIDFSRFKVHGRGGTSFVPAFKWIAQQADHKQQMPDAVIYMTDGFGDFPKTEPQYPVLWIVPPHGQPRFPWGEVIRMK